jgi:hypothetical protein
VRDERTDYLRQEGVDVLDVVRFVDDDILETELLEGGLLDEADLVARDAHFEVLWDESVRNNIWALLLCAGKDNDVDVWSPLFELARTILEG